MYRLTSLIAFAIIVLLSPTARAVEFGWQTLPEGGIEYLVQVEPALIDSFREQGFTSDVPPGLRDIRRIRIAVGQAELPNVGDMLGPKAKADGAQPTSAKGEPAPDPEASADRKTFDGALLDSKASPLPFLRTGPVRDIASLASTPAERTGASGDKSASETGARSTGALSEATQPPRIDGDDGPHDAARPAGVGVTAENPAAGSNPKPWLPLMAALLGLFCLLGANLYLGWIHQGLRAKYLALGRTGNPAAA